MSKSGPQPRRLLVMRHAKAEPYAASDQVRRLTGRGRSDAAAVGHYLAEQELVPTHALVSSAVRTRETWAAVADASGCTAEPVLADRLYSGGVEDILAAVHQLPADAQTVLFIGHNPAAAYLAHALDDGSGNAEAVSQLLRGFPTSAVAVLEVDVPWAELAEGNARVCDVHVRGA